MLRLQKYIKSMSVGEDLVLTHTHTHSCEFSFFRSAYCAASVASLTNIITPKLFENTTNWILRYRCPPLSSYKDPFLLNADVYTLNLPGAASVCSAARTGRVV